MSLSALKEKIRLKRKLKVVEGKDPEVKMKKQMLSEVPIDFDKVKKEETRKIPNDEMLTRRLRVLNVPIHLFGENEQARYKRLQKVEVDARKDIQKRKGVNVDFVSSKVDIEKFELDLSSDSFKRQVDFIDYSIRRFFYYWEGKEKKSGSKLLDETKANLMVRKSLLSKIFFICSLLITNCSR